MNETAAFLLVINFVLAYYLFCDFIDMLKQKHCSNEANYDCEMCDYWDCPYHRCKHERDKFSVEE